MKDGVRFWIGPGVISVIGVTAIIFGLTRPSVIAPVSRPSTTRPVSILTTDNKAVYEWERKDALNWAFAQTATTLNYFFLAAGVILAFIMKAIDRKPEERAYVSKPAWIILTNAGVACLISLCAGILAFGCFPEVGAAQAFTIFHGAFAILSLVQMLALILAVLLVVWALILIVRSYV
ncbi:MAG TPA: hypothetical protein VH475_09070 [Tepidisphaeraceae bacterium]